MTPRRNSIPSKDSPSLQHQQEKSALIPSNNMQKQTSVNSNTSEKSTDPSLLINQPSKWKNWWIRASASLVMVSGFLGILLLGGPGWVIFTVILIQTVVYQEVISIAYLYTRNQSRVPWFRALNWYLLFSTNYFLYGESLIQYRPKYFEFVLQPLVKNHRFISFMLYVIGFVVFVINLKPDYRYQISMFAWTHMTLLLVIFTSHFTINNIFEGLIWFVLPVSLVVFNDCAAYVFGFFFGKTPLIRVSPKKTWEGFMGALVTTPIFAFFFAGFIASFVYMTCPVSKVDVNVFTYNAQCATNLVFVPHEYRLPSPLADLARWLLWREVKTVVVLPVQFHALALSIFASVIAPVGGLFASGVKRAFKIKDYGDIIPGHGGITDRMDCQFLMGLFSYMYFQSFIGSTGVDAAQLLISIAHLPQSQQLEIYNAIRESLTKQGLLIAAGN